MLKRKALLFLVIAIAVGAASVGAGWKWHHGGHGSAGVERIAGWTWDQAANVQF